MPRKVVHEVALSNVSVDEQMSFVLDFLRVRGATTLLTLVSHMTEKVRIIVTVIGAITALFAATVGLAQNDIKRVIAYSTCSQLGYMFVGIGVGGYSLLFLCNGISLRSAVTSPPNLGRWNV